MISVIIPALNEEKSIENCLISIENQDFDDFEIIVVDGSSRDRTVEIAEKYARVIKQRSSTIGGARREGAMAASGDTLAFTDADSIADCSWLSRINDNMRRYDLSVGPVYFYENNFGAAVVQLWRRMHSIERLFGFYRILGPNMGIKRDVYMSVEGHGDISLLEDYDFSNKVAKGRIRSKYDKKQIVYTSARRMKKLLPYIWLYVYGHYHYAFSQDLRKLKHYPRTEE